MRRLGLALGFSVLAVAPPAAQAAEGLPSLVEELQSLLREPAYRGAEVGLMVMDAASGQTLLAHDADRLLPPASVTKLFTSAVALKVLSPQYVWKTEVHWSAKPVNGVLAGPLYITGYGDPGFVSERVWAVADFLRKRGINRVEGDIVVDDSYFDSERYGLGWGPLTRSWYHAPVGALSIDHNAIWARGRYIAIGGDPAIHAGEAIARTLEVLGIEVVGRVRSELRPVEAQLVESFDSRPLRDLVADVNKYSNNFMAEQLLKSLGAHHLGPPGSAAKGLEVMAEALAAAGIEPGSYALHDGSGLSLDNRVSAAQVVKLLMSVAYDFEIAPEFRASLRVAGAEGAGSRFQDPICKRRMRLKTGHLSGVNTLAGYAVDASGRELAFAILTRNLRGSRWRADRSVERLAELFLASRRPSAEPEREPIAEAPDDEADEEAEEEAQAARRGGR